MCLDCKGRRNRTHKVLLNIGQASPPLDHLRLHPATPSLLRAAQPALPSVLQSRAAPGSARGMRSYQLQAAFIHAAANLNPYRRARHPDEFDEANSCLKDCHYRFGYGHFRPLQSSIIIMVISCKACDPGVVCLSSLLYQTPGSSLLVSN